MCSESSPVDSDTGPSESIKLNGLCLKGGRNNNSVMACVTINTHCFLQKDNSKDTAVRRPLYQEVTQLL